MNLKQRYKNLSIKSRSTVSKLNTQKSTSSLNTQIQRSAIVFGILLVSSIGYSQCTVNDLPDTTQNNIIKKFYQLESCEAARVVDSTRISNLKLSNEELNKTNLSLNDKLIRRRRTSLIVSIVSGIGGIYLGSKIK